MLPISVRKFITYMRISAIHYIILFFPAHIHIRCEFRKQVFRIHSLMPKMI